MSYFFVPPPWDDSFFDAESHVKRTRRNEQFFCKVCQWIFAHSSYHSPDDYPTNSIRGTISHDSMIKSAESGCMLCAQLCSPLYNIGVDRTKFSWSHNWSSDGKHVFTFKLFYNLLNYSGLVIPASMTQFACMRSFDIQEEYNTKNIHQNMLGGLPETADNEVTWGVIHEWLSECSYTHGDCNHNPHSREKPTRLIDVEILMDPKPREDRVLLVEPRAGLLTEKYATLSHCWGGEVPTLLKGSETCERLSSGWAVEELPNTFREAVITARKLSIRYLWIDSLCIQQDCDEDWKRESQTMDTVYSKSYLNIAATGAKNSSVGLFLERKLRSCQPFEADIRQHGGTSGEDIFTPYLFFRQDLWKTFVNESPLGRRGWVAQERELSPRQLNFTEAGVFWECRCLRDIEFPFDWPQWSEDGNVTRGYKSLVRRIETFEKKGSLMSESDRSAELAHIYNEWNNTIQGYCPLKFTKEADRPIAIAGLAKKVHSVVKDTYLAGLWKSRLLCQLLWEVDWTLLTASSHPGRPTQIPAPTWTWLSTRSPIAMFGSPQHSSTSLGDFYPVAEVASDEPSHVEMDLAGELSGGCIRLRALHWPTSINVEFFSPGDRVHLHGAPGYDIVYGWPDEMPNSEIGMQELIAVPIMIFPNSYAAAGLLLKRTHGEQERYIRHGVFRILCKHKEEQTKDSFKYWADKLQRITAETKFQEFKEFLIF